MVAIHRLLRTFHRWLALAQPRAIVRPEPIAATPWTEPADERLARLARQCLQGERAAAELELHEWRRQEECPPAARVLLASLLAQRGRLDDARAALLPADRARGEQDAQAMQLLIAILAATDLTDAAARMAVQLHHAYGQEPAIAAWIQVLQAPSVSDLPLLPDAQVEQLAAELVARPGVIPSLVVAQSLQPAASDIALLRHAITRMAREIQDDPQQMLTICQAQAELAMLASDTSDARRWAHRGLRINAYAAPLALVLSQIEDDPTIGPSATEVLAEAVAAHPTYPDLRAALIQREHAQGRPEAARLHLADWLATQPDHPLARKLQQELAA